MEAEIRQTGGLFFSPYSSSATASRPADKSAKERARQTVKAPATKRETSQQAKELFEDAKAAKEVYIHFMQEFTNIQWFQRPEGKLQCRNFEACKSDDAVYWCHPCGYAYCLNCRSHGHACSHHIVNYSSELGEQFMPDSIGSNESPFDIGELMFWDNPTRSI